ncbi:hypothetical protein M9Y10_022336 [Tritrichomonas musculus]|uniref:DDE-1 domain-containing protein n=1 Tax=Tritrichomonas musculus TaxID=1915356 RepID=A0ABR2KSJ7_9EUKA
MEFLDQSDFSDDLKWIIHQRVNEKLTYRQIQAAWEIAHQAEENDQIISPYAIKTCIKRSSLALSWYKGHTYGNEIYLSKPDMKELKNYIHEQCMNDDPTDATDLLAEAMILKKRRQQNAVKFLRSINCENITAEIEEEFIDEQVRSWINAHLEEMEASIRSSRVVDFDRYLSCNLSIIQTYFTVARRVLQNVHPSLIFGGDESYLDPQVSNKYVIPKEIHEFIVQNKPQIPHISVMFAHNCVGVAVPPFQILKDFENTPKELNTYIQTGQLWAISNSSGWQTRNSFLIWSINFINWVSNYRLTLDESIRNKSAVLILDGHNSRENPLTLYLLKMNNIDVIILLASPLKTRMASFKFINLVKTIANSLPSKAAQARYLTVSALINSWSSIPREVLIKSFEVTGICPMNPSNPLNNPLTNRVNHPPPPVRRNTLNISSSLLTSIQMRIAIYNKNNGTNINNVFQIYSPTDESLYRYCLEKSDAHGFILQKFPPLLVSTFNYYYKDKFYYF